MKYNHCCICDSPPEVSEMIKKCTFVFGIPASQASGIDLIVSCGGLIVGRVFASGTEGEMLVYDSSRSRQRVLMKDLDLEKSITELQDCGELHDFCSTAALDIIHSAAKLEGWRDYFENLTADNYLVATTLGKIHHIETDNTWEDGSGHHTIQ